MKFDPARITGMISKLADPQFDGQDGETKAAEFVAEQFTQIGMKVERRDVVGSRFPQRTAPWIGWLVYGALITASYLMLRGNNRLVMGLAIFLIFVGLAWLHAVLNDAIRLGLRQPPLETASLVVASFPSESSPPVRVVFQAVLGGLRPQFFQSFREDRRWIAKCLHYGFLIGAALRCYQPSGILSFFPLDSIFLGMIWIEILCVLSWEFRQSRSSEGAQRADRRGLSVLIELARTWPRTRSNQVEAVFAAAGGQRLNCAGSREVVHLINSDWSSKPTFLVLFFAPGGDEILVVDDLHSKFRSKKLIDDAAKSLWIPIRPTRSWTIAPIWPLARTTAGNAFAIIGSDLNARCHPPGDPQILQRVLQLSSETALRWAKRQQEPADSAS